MRFDDTTLFTYLRRSPFGGRLGQAQIDGVNLLIETCRAEGVTDLRHVANILAQVFHETGARMQPVRETFATSDAQMKSRLETAFRNGRLPSVRTPYWRDGFAGRGHIQITHRANYEKAGKALGIDLVGNPALAFDPIISAKIAVRGMRDGWFTGRKLVDFFNATADDAVGARRIVNGTDKAQLITTYHTAFLGALKAAETATPLPKDVVPEMARADDVKPSESPSLWTMIASYVSGSGGLALLSGINNPYALVALLAVVAAGGIFAFLVLTGRVSFNRGA
jgi:putative chitinase